MPKLNKRLRQLVNKMVDSSLDKSGSVNNKKAMSFVSTLKKLPHSQAILSLMEYSKGIQREINKTTLTVESPIKLSSSLQKTIAKSLSSDHQISKTLFVLNPSLLGGVKIKIGDTLIDDSLKERSNQLKERIVNG